MRWASLFADAAGVFLFVGPFFRNAWRDLAAPGRHGCAGGAGRRGGLHRQLLGDFRGKVARFISTR